MVRSYALLWLVKRNQARLPRRFGPLQPAIAVWKTPRQEGLPPSAPAQPHQPFFPDGSGTAPKVSRGAPGDEAPGKVWDRLLVFITASRATPAFLSSLEGFQARLEGLEYPGLVEGGSPEQEGWNEVSFKVPSNPKTIP